MRWMWCAALALTACSQDVMSEDTQVVVTRPDRDDQSFEAVAFDCSSSDGALVDCTHGDPAITGLHMILFFDPALGEVAEGTELAHGVDFGVTSLEGAEDELSWGASGSSSFWAGDLTITVEDASGERATARLDGMLETTEDVESFGLNPIEIVFMGAGLTLP